VVSWQLRFRKERESYCGAPAREAEEIKAIVEPRPPRALPEVLPAGCHESPLDGSRVLPLASVVVSNAHASR
jgi:hypothetical protein